MITPRPNCGYSSTAWSQMTFSTCVLDHTHLDSREAQRRLRVCAGLSGMREPAHPDRSRMVYGYVALQSTAVQVMRIVRENLACLPLTLALGTAITALLLARSSRLIGRLASGSRLQCLQRFPVLPMYRRMPDVRSQAGFCA